MATSFGVFTTIDGTGPNAIGKTLVAGPSPAPFVLLGTIPSNSATPTTPTTGQTWPRGSGG